MLDIATEPRDATYFRLLAYAAELCATFSLTWSDDHTFAYSADEVERSLKPFLVREERTDRWPGTVSYGSKATVRYYCVNAESVDLLKRPGSLYAWLAPSFPEDLAFYSATDEVWLTSISHEREAWFEASPELATELKRRIPDLEVEQRNE